MEKNIMVENNIRVLVQEENNHKIFTIIDEKEVLIQEAAEGIFKGLVKPVQERFQMYSALPINDHTYKFVVY